MNCPYPTLCLSVFTLPSWFGLLVATEGVPSPRRHRDRTGRRSNILPLHPSYDGDHLHLSWQFLNAIVPRGEVTFPRSARPTAQVPSRRPNVCRSFVIVVIPGEPGMTRKFRASFAGALDRRGRAGLLAIHYAMVFFLATAVVLSLIVSLAPYLG